MRILFFVNHFDEADDLQGFFVGWVRAVAQRTSAVIVIAQYVGAYSVPDNVRVVALDKTKNHSRFVRLVRFIALLIQFRLDYDHCVVVMAPTWSLIASIVVRAFGRGSYLWYAVWRGSFILRLATWACTRVLTSVPEAFPFASKKVLMLGQGIDTDIFVPRPEVRKAGSILFLGRISPVKKVEFLLEALVVLRKNHPGSTDGMQVSIAGAPITVRDQHYYHRLQEKAHSLGLGAVVSWPGRISHNNVVRWYQEADIVVNMTPRGSFDKAMLEAMACGALVLASNEALRQYYSSELQRALLYAPDNLDDFVRKLEVLLTVSPGEKDRLRAALRGVVGEYHSQKQWTNKFITALS